MKRPCTSSMGSLTLPELLHTWSLCWCAARATGSAALPQKVLAHVSAALLSDRSSTTSVAALIFAVETSASHFSCALNIAAATGGKQQELSEPAALFCATVRTHIRSGGPNSRSPITFSLAERQRSLITVGSKQQHCVNESCQARRISRQEAAVARYIYI